MATQQKPPQEAAKAQPATSTADSTTDDGTEQAESTKADAPKVEVNVPSTHQQYLDSLLSAEAETPVFNPQKNPSEDGVFTDEGFAGVDPIYQNYANDTDKPGRAEEGPDKLAEDFAAGAYDKKDETTPQVQEAYDSLNHGDQPK